MAARKTRDEWTIQGNYGYGWDDLTAHDSWKDARDELRDYFAEVYPDERARR